MNGSTSKIIKKYAFFTDKTRAQRREMKRVWQTLSHRERRVLANRLKIENDRMGTSLRIKTEIQNNRSLRKHTMGDGTKVLWMQSEKHPGEAGILFRKGSLVWGNTTSPDVLLQVNPTEHAFGSLWDAAVEDPMPQEHHDRLQELAWVQTETSALT